MIWKVNKDGIELFDKNYLDQFLTDFKLDSSKVSLDNDELSIKFKDYPFAGFILNLKIEETDGVKKTRGVLHFFNPIFVLLGVLVLGAFIYGVIQSSFLENFLVFTFLIIILILNYFKYRKIRRKLFDLFNFY